MAARQYVDGSWNEKILWITFTGFLTPHFRAHGTVSVREKKYQQTVHEIPHARERVTGRAGKISLLSCFASLYCESTLVDVHRGCSEKDSVDCVWKVFKKHTRAGDLFIRSRSEAGEVSPDQRR